MFRKNKQVEELQKDPIEVEVEAIMGPPPAEQQPQSFSNPALIEDVVTQSAPEPDVLPNKETFDFVQTKETVEPITEMQNDSDIDDSQTAEAVRDIIRQEADQLLTNPENFVSPSKGRAKVKKTAKSWSVKKLFILIIFIVALVSLLTLIVPFVNF